MGENQDSSALFCVVSEEMLPDKTTFRLRVVEHLSWDNYDNVTKRFKPGDKGNKPIAGREFQIKMLDGSVIKKITDEDGVIELTEQKENAKFEVIFEPENATLNNKYNLFYNKITLVRKEL